MVVTGNGAGWRIYKAKTVGLLKSDGPVLFLLFELNYLAVSAAVVSTTVVSTTVVSTVVVSAASVLAVLSPQDAKEIAAIATNIKTNFFIFFAF